MAEKPNGPRGDATFPLEKLNKYENLILLCNVHHKQIDDQELYFTVERLHDLKIQHEKWVRATLTAFDPVKQADDERWADYIEEWATRSRLDDWLEETYGLLAPVPHISKSFLADLRPLPEWFLSRVWPCRYASLERALRSFGKVLNDFLNVFEDYSISRGDDEWTEQFYKIDEYDPERYDLLKQQFDFHVDLICDLTCELTRAANHVADVVRATIDPTFRLHQGHLLIRQGMGMDLKERTYCVQYAPADLTEDPYPGLSKFLQIRSSRDISFGEGQDPTNGPGTGT